MVTSRRQRNEREMKQMISVGARVEETKLCKPFLVPIAMAMASVPALAAFWIRPTPNSESSNTLAA